MRTVDIHLVVGDGDWNKLLVGTCLDTVEDVVEVTRDYVRGPLRETYPALYTFTEFGLQAIESFVQVVGSGTDYTAKIGVADLSNVPLFNRELAAQLAANFVTALHLKRGPKDEEALRLLHTQGTGDWRAASFTVEPGGWLARHLRGESGFVLPSISA